MASISVQNVLKRNFMLLRQSHCPRMLFFHVLIRYNKCENRNVFKRIFRLNSKNLKGLSLVIWDTWSYNFGETIKIQIVFIFILHTYITHHFRFKILHFCLMHRVNVGASPHTGTRDPGPRTQ